MTPPRSFVLLATTVGAVGAGCGGAVDGTNGSSGSSGCTSSSGGSTSSSGSGSSSGGGSCLNGVTAFSEDCCCPPGTSCTNVAYGGDGDAGVACEVDCACVCAAVAPSAPQGFRSCNVDGRDGDRRLSGRLTASSLYLRSLPVLSHLRTFFPSAVLLKPGLPFGMAPAVSFAIIAVLSALIPASALNCA